MSITVIVLVVEVAVILLGIAGFLFFLRWKRKKIQTVEFEILLDNVVSKEEGRKAQLIQLLGKDYALELDEAKQAAGYMIEAEKQFLQQFLKQQIEQTTVTDFYENLCELLDQYLSFVHTSKIEQAKPDGDKSEQLDTVETEVLNSDTSEETDSEKVQQVIESDAAEKNLEEEPDWGDTFSESGDEMDEETKIGFDAEEKRG